MIEISEERFAQAYQNRSQENHGVTIAALYGEDKPARFGELIRFFLDRLTGELNDWFEPYDTEQIHATIYRSGRAEFFG